MREDMGQAKACRTGKVVCLLSSLGLLCFLVAIKARKERCDPVCVVWQNDTFCQSGASWLQLREKRR
jgi:hypothetical protein